MTKKYYIIDLMLILANECGILEDIDQFNKIRVLNSMVYLAIFQKYVNNHRYDLDSIAEYFEFNDYETYLLSASCSRLKRFEIIDFEGGFIRELLPIDKTYIHTIISNLINFTDPMGLNPYAGAEIGALIPIPGGTIIGAGIGALGGYVIGEQISQIIEKRSQKPSGGDKWVPNPNPRPGIGTHGWEHENGDVYIPTGWGGNAHGDPHWDVQHPDGTYTNVRPKIRPVKK